MNSVNKGKMLSFQQEENRKVERDRREAERNAAEEAERIKLENKGPPVEPVVVLLTPAPPKTTYGQFGSTSTIKKVWAYELVNITELAVCPSRSGHD